MPTGMSSATEVAVLESATVGLGRTLYLYMFTGTLGNTMADDGGRGSLSLATGGGGGALAKTVLSSDWATASAGAPTTKQLTGTISMTATGGTGLGTLVWWALATVNTITNNTTWDAAVAAGQVAYHGPVTDSVGAATSVTVNATETFTYDSSHPLKVQLGDPTDTFG